MSFIRCVSLMLVGVSPLGAQTQRTAPSASAAKPEPPAWAMPLGPAAATPFDSVMPRRVPGSTASFTEQRAHDRYQCADWYPESHPAMPDVVARGRRPAVWACGYCHLPDGAGRPENAALAGLPEKYITRQMAAFRSGERGSPWHAPNKPADIMRGIADSATVAEVKQAARYFSRLAPRRRARVVEAERIPAVQAGRRPVFSRGRRWRGAAWRAAHRSRERCGASRAARRARRVRGVRPAGKHRAGTRAREARHSGRKKLGVHELSWVEAARRRTGATDRGAVAVVLAASADGLRGRLAVDEGRGADARGGGNAHGEGHDLGGSVRRLSFAMR